MIAANAIRSHWFGKTRRPAEAIVFNMGDFRWRWAMHMPPDERIDAGSKPRQPRTSVRPNESQPTLVQGM